MILRSLLIACSLLFVASCESTSQETAPDVLATPAPLELGGLPNVHVMDGLYFGGQPSPEDFDVLRAAGIRTVVNLRGGDEVTEFNEEVVASDAGLDYVHLPFRGAGQLTDEVFDRTRELLNSDRGPLLLHCGSANRVGAVWLPHRVLDQGVPFELALEEAKRVGLRTDAYVDRAKEYIESRR